MQALRGAWRSLSAPLAAPLGGAATRSPFVSGFHTTAACLKQRFMGEVISSSMQKSVVVAVYRLQKHPKYHKIMKLRSKIMAHAEYDEYVPGDKVIIEQHRPISKNKSFIVVKHTDEQREAELAVMREEQQRAREVRREQRRLFFEEQRRLQAIKDEEIANRDP